MRPDQSRPVSKRVPQPPPLPKRRTLSNLEAWVLVVGGIIVFLVALVVIKAAPNILGGLTGSSTYQVESTVKNGIERDTNLKVLEIHLVRESGNRYTGFANTNLGQLHIEATADGGNVIYTMTPSNRRF